jgi:hypothetical protein
MQAPRIEEEETEVFIIRRYKIWIFELANVLNLFLLRISIYVLGFNLKRLH